MGAERSELSQAETDIGIGTQKRGDFVSHRLLDVELPGAQRRIRGIELLLNLFPGEWRWLGRRELFHQAKEADNSPQSDRVSKNSVDHDGERGLDEGSASIPMLNQRT